MKLLLLLLVVKAHFDPQDTFTNISATKLISYYGPYIELKEHCRLYKDGLYVNLEPLKTTVNFETSTFYSLKSAEPKLKEKEITEYD